jgi:hypothetical protein
MARPMPRVPPVTRAIFLSLIAVMESFLLLPGLVF